MKRWCIGIACCLGGYLGAQNLVPNPSFETLSSVPTTYGQITRATPWYSAYGSSDLFHPSQSASSIGIPTNYFGTQAPHSGSIYAGIASSQTNSYHEYIGIQLISPLTVGQAYYCEAYVSAGEGSYRLGTNNFGFKFSASPLMGGAGDPPINTTPEVNWTPVISDYTNWVQISGTFTATAASAYLTLGRFYSVASTTWAPLGTSGSINSQYWFIDDVVVQPAVPFAMPGHTFTARPLTAHTVGVEWEFDEVEGIKEFTLRRSVDGGTTWREVAGIPASSNVLRYAHTDRPHAWGQEVRYMLRQVHDDGSVAYSEVVKVTLPMPTLEESLALSPNPLHVGDPCVAVMAAGAAGSVQWTLYDLWGRTVARGEAVTVYGKVEIALETGALSPGTYLFRAIAGTQVAAHKLVVR